MKKAPKEFRFAALAVDVVVFGFIDGTLQALVSPVHRPPHYIDVEGFLGGMVTSNETAKETSQRILKEKGNLTVGHLEQLYTFSDVNRDLRNRVVSVAYLGLVRPDEAAMYAHTENSFQSVKKLLSSTLAYDHQKVLRMALQRLQGKISYTTVIQYLLPRHFTLSELQETYETILGKTFDKRNFRKKILSLDIIKDTKRVQEGVQNRPAALYTFVSSKVHELPSII